MKFNELLREVHHRIESQEHARITQFAMAKRLGISMRTYVEYLRGTNSPLGMQVMISLLSQLNDDEVITVVREWSSKKQFEVETEANN